MTPTNTPTSKCCDACGFNNEPRGYHSACRGCPCHTPTTDSKNSSDKKHEFRTFEGVCHECHVNRSRAELPCEGDYWAEEEPMNTTDTGWEKIPLSTGRSGNRPARGFALVDCSDFEELSQYKWNMLKSRNTQYAQREVRNADGKVEKITMHVQIMQPPKGMEVDHIDGNGLNNQRSNLRICTRTQNRQNVGAMKNNKSGYKGVSLHKATNKWLAQIRVDGKHHHLGLFTNPEEASKAYIQACKKYHGEFANLEAALETP